MFNSPVLYFAVNLLTDLTKIFFKLLWSINGTVCLG